jgi:hypothetical protein
MSKAEKLNKPENCSLCRSFSSFSQGRFWVTAASKLSIGDLVAFHSCSTSSLQAGILLARTIHPYGAYDTMDGKRGANEVENRFLSLPGLPSTPHYMMGEGVR